jgi:hypothetical protein
MKFVVYEVWTRNMIIEADDAEEALAKAEPAPRDDMMLCNWHVVRVDDSRSAVEIRGGMDRDLTKFMA